MSGNNQKTCFQGHFFFFSQHKLFIVIPSVTPDSLQAQATATFTLIPFPLSFGDSAEVFTSGALTKWKACFLPSPPVSLSHKTSDVYNSNVFLVLLYWTQSPCFSFFSISLTLLLPILECLPDRRVNAACCWARFEKILTIISLTWVNGNWP